MPIVYPAMNTVWFWFDKKNRRKLHGKPQDVMRKYDLLISLQPDMSGLEIFIDPERLVHENEFTNSFYKKYSELRHKSVHIGNSNENFLDDFSIEKKLSILSKIMDSLQSDVIILHAHHLKKNRKKRKEKLLSVLPNKQICIENNGFDNLWGGSINGLVEIFTDCPEFMFCLDIAHVKDFNYQLKDFYSNSLLSEKIKEIHYSYSTYYCEKDPYEDQGYKNYNPFHALFSVLGLSPSKKTKEFILKYPIIIEGIIPKEDIDLEYLKKEELSLLAN